MMFDEIADIYSPDYSKWIDRSKPLGAFSDTIRRNIGDRIVKTCQVDEVVSKDPYVTVIDPERDPRWDIFVDAHPLGWISYLSSWEKVLEKSYKNFTGNFFAIFDNSGENIIAGIPLYQLKIPIFGVSLISITHATLCDPLIL